MTFSPANNFKGRISASYDITDSDGDVENAPITIDVIADAGNKIFAGDDSAVTDMGTPVSGTLVENDDDPEDDAFTVNRESQSI